jgi:sugar/nucleoside kinase (ribokinase family)
VRRLLVFGSIALDSVETPFGSVTDALGGAAVYASSAASLFAPVLLVGVVGEDFPAHHLEALRARGINTSAVQRVEGGWTFRWKGRYDADMNQAHTLATQLNVLADFRPCLPEKHRHAECVFLANIDPELQLSVLDQLSAPELVACDTMNFWIESKWDALQEVLRRVDLALVNEAEARQLTGMANLVQAGRALLALGPSYVVVKKGEHGALLFSQEGVFAAPPYPLALVKDPTGAGDSFAGGLMGLMCSLEGASEANLRRAVIAGTVMASFCCEEFGLGRLLQVAPADVCRRYEELRGLVHFDGLESAELTTLP